MGKLNGKTAIVTGGAHGLGLHFAEALAREGATVAILDIADHEAAASAMNKGLGGQSCFGLMVDVAAEFSVEQPLLRSLAALAASTSW